MSLTQRQSICLVQSNNYKAEQVEIPAKDLNDSNVELDAEKGSTSGDQLEKLPGSSSRKGKMEQSMKEMISKLELKIRLERLRFERKEGDFESQRKELKSQKKHFEEHKSLSAK